MSVDAHEILAGLKPRNRVPALRIGERAFDDLPGRSDGGHLGIVNLDALRQRDASTDCRVDPSRQVRFETAVWS